MMKVFLRVMVIAVLMAAILVVAAYHRTQASPAQSQDLVDTGPNTAVQAGTLVSVKGERYFNVAKDEKPRERWFRRSEKIEEFQGIIGDYDHRFLLNRFRYCQVGPAIKLVSQMPGVTYGKVEVKVRSIFFFKWYVWTEDVCLGGQWIDGWMDIEKDTARPLR